LTLLRSGACFVSLFCALNPAEKIDGFRYFSFIVLDLIFIPTAQEARGVIFARLEETMNSLPIPRDIRETEYFRLMEEFRLAYNRGYGFSRSFCPPVHLPHEEGETTVEWMARYWKRLNELPRVIIKFERGLKPIDLRAYEAMRDVERDRDLPPKVTAEIINHKDALHPYMLKRLLEALRAKAGEHRRLTDYFDGIADQLETKDTRRP
jgi:hypothetical protein